MNDLISQIERGEKIVVVGTRKGFMLTYKGTEGAELFRLAKKSQESPWIPVTPETMPEELRTILLQESGVEYPLAGWLQGERWVIIGMDRTFPLKAFNFWMPLPALPEQEGR